MLLYEIRCLKNNKGYVGQTTQPLETRWASHCREALFGNSKTSLHRAIRKYGKENFTIEVIEICNSIEKLNKQEVYWILKKEYTKRENGYNLTSGGKNFKFSQEVKEKISKSLTGMKFKRHISKEDARDIAKDNGSKTFADTKTYNRWLIANGSKEFNVYKAICVQPKSRGVSALYKKDEFIGTWLNTVQFNLDIFNKKTKGHISECLSGKRKQYKGYIFEYKDNLNNKELKENYNG